MATDRNDDVLRRPEEPEAQDRTDGSGDAPELEPASAGSEEDVTSDGEGRSADGGDAGELLLRFEARERYVAELHDELAAARLAVDEARALMVASGTRVRDLEGERDRLQERVRELEEEERRRGRWRMGQDRQVARLQRELERRDAEIRRLKDGIDSSRGEMEARGRESAEAVARKEAALEGALRRVEGLERDLEERESKVVELRAAVDRLRAEIDFEYELRRRMAEPANRLRAAIDLFNDSEHPRSVDSITKSLGQPEIHVELGQEANEPPAILTFTWHGISRQIYHSNPGLGVDEPRVYLAGATEDLSGVERKPPNARLGRDGTVMLGL